MPHTLANMVNATHTEPNFNFREGGSRWSLYTAAYMHVHVNQAPRGSYYHRSVEQIANGKNVYYRNKAVAWEKRKCDWSVGG